MTENIVQERELRLKAGWAEEFWQLRRRDRWYHTFVIAALSSILTLEVVRYLF